MHSGGAASALAILLCVTTILAACGGGSNSTPPATAPTITQQPASVTVSAGQAANFAVASTGTAPLTYQWYLNGAASGTNASSFSIASTTAGQTGATVYVKISNAAGKVTSSTATLTVNAASDPAAPTITTQPANQTVTVGQTATFTVAATGTAPLTYAWFLNGAAAGTNSATYAIANATASQSGAQVYVKVSNATGSATSNTVTLTVNQPVSSSVNVLTYHNDVARTGQNLQETALTQSNVGSATFGKLGFLNADGLVDAEPLYVSGVKTSSGTHNVVYVVTENDTAYAYDADSYAQLWKVSTLGSGEVPSDDHGCFQVTPQIGITSTPVIDKTAGANGTMYLLALSKDAQGHYFHRLHALDIATGAELDGGPTTVNPTYPAKQGTDSFDPSVYKERAALLLSGGTVYISFSSHCDSGGYTGWGVRFDEKTLAQK